MTATARHTKAASLPTIRKMVKLMRETGAETVRVMFDDQNRPYVEAVYSETDDGMADRIDAA